MAIDVAIMIEGQDGLTWPRWQKLAAAAEDLGYAGLYRSDHFTNATGPHTPALEMWTSLTWLASHTERISFGPIVSPVSFRNPVVTAWTAAAVDDLSGGRLELGIGAGWQEREHTSFGFGLPELAPRFDRFAEGLEVVTRLLRSEEPFAYNGRFYQLEDALLLPRPARKNGPPITVGGNGPKKTLPLAAKHADEWNAVYASAAQFTQLSSDLDGLAIAEGRDPKSIRRTLMTRAILARDEAELNRRLRSGDDLAAMKERGAVLIGYPAEIAERIQELGSVGVQRVMMQWLDLDDIEGLEALAKAFN